MKKAPWPDFAGNDLFEGDKIKHPCGQIGIIVYRPERESISDKWLVNYGGYLESRLCLQIDGKGQAVKDSDNGIGIEIENAKKNLPSGYSMELCVEAHQVFVRLLYENGNKCISMSESGMSIAGQIAHVVDLANDTEHQPVADGSVLTKLINKILIIRRCYFKEHDRYQALTICFSPEGRYRVMADKNIHRYLDNNVPPKSIMGYSFSIDGEQDDLFRIEINE